MNGQRLISGILIGSAALLAAATVSAAADVYGASNFGAFTYPPHNCGPKPQAPERPEGFRAHFEAQDYNARVEDYNARIARFSQCINDYIERSRLDMQRIHEKQLQAVRDAS